MVDLTQLIPALTSVLTTTKVHTDDASRNTAGHDTWPVSTKAARLQRHENTPDVVVTAGSWDDVRATLRVAADLDAPVTVRALASSVTGQPLPTQGGIVVDVTGIPADYDLDENDMTVRVGATYNGGALEDALQERGWTLGHSPQSLYRSTVGGWLATLATGQFSSAYGGIEDLVIGYTVLLATGESVEVSASPRAAMGPDLRQLFLGSEGTLGIITSVEVKAFPLPEARLLETVAMPDVPSGLAFMREVMARGMSPFLVRFYDTDEARHALKDPGFDSPVLFLGAQGDTRRAQLELDTMLELAAARGGRALGADGAAGWMQRRFDFSTVENLLDSDGGYAETIEIAHRWSGIEGVYDELKAELAPLADEVLGHFSHVYTQGTSLYVILLGRADDDEQALARLRTIWETAMSVCLRHGAELSHHHGGGLARSPYSRRSLGPAHLLLRRLKSALDPNGTLNPGKLGL